MYPKFKTLCYIAVILILGNALALEKAQDFQEKIVQSKVGYPVYLSIYLFAPIHPFPLTVRNLFWIFHANYCTVNGDFTKIYFLIKKYIVTCN